MGVGEFWNSCIVLPRPPPTLSTSRYQTYIVVIVEGGSVHQKHDGVPYYFLLINGGTLFCGHAYWGVD